MKYAPICAAALAVVLVSHRAMADEGVEIAPADPGEAIADDGESTGRTEIGGYAEVAFEHMRPDVGDAETIADLARLVVGVDHEFTDRLRWRSAIEVEHAGVGGEGVGEIGVEEAYLEWDLIPDGVLSLRTGVVLVPMGIVNLEHEPPTYNGVERPRVDAVVVPSTWREAAVGVAGEPVEGLRYWAYLMSGLDPLGFSPDGGLRGGRQQADLARTDGLALSGRVEYAPIEWLAVGGSGYAGMAGPNADLRNAMGAPVDITVPVIGGELDLQAAWNGLEGRAEFASWQLGDTGDLRAAFDAEGNPAPDVGSTIMGGYAELGYDVFGAMGSAQALVPFFRFERYDTLFKVIDRPRSPADEPAGVTEMLLGVSYRPIPQVVFKGDAGLRNPDGADNHAWLLNAGVGLMF